MSERKYAPRSGGRTAEQRSSTRSGARRYPTQGTAALKAEAAEPLRGTAAGQSGVTQSRVTQPQETQPSAGRARNSEAAPPLRVAPPAPISAPRAPFIAVVIAIVVAGVIGILLINTKTNENTFEISKLQDQKTALDNQQQKLENQIAGYESTGNLDVAARRLGLVKADSPAYIRLPDGKVIGVPKPGTGPASVTAQDPAGATGNVPDGDAQNGVTPAGTGSGTTAGNSTVQSGAVTDGTVQGGPAQNGVTQGDAAQGGAAQGGAAQGGAAQGGAAQGGATQDGAGRDGTAGQDAGDQSAG
jgi:hypothetical protein